MHAEQIDLSSYADYLENLAKKYLNNVYLYHNNNEEQKSNRLNSSNNTPIPGSFDKAILLDNNGDVSQCASHTEQDFEEIYGNGSQASHGIPLFVFNYLDYLLWKNYAETVKGESLNGNNPRRIKFFAQLGCSDFGLEVFNNFYFSRTRRSLEHYYPQAAVDGTADHLNQDQINCFGNYAMIGAEINSSASNWSPKTKLDHYLDASGKISRISVASLKFMIMLQICKDGQWRFEEIQNHQHKMVCRLCDISEEE